MFFPSLKSCISIRSCLVVLCVLCVGEAGGRTAHISYTSCKTCSLVVSLSRAHSTQLCRVTRESVRGGGGWRRGARMEELMRQRCLSLPHAYTRTHTHTHTRAIKLFLAREREHMSCIACLPACHLSNQSASQPFAYALYSLLFFQGEQR